MKRSELLRSIDIILKTKCANCELKRQPGFGWPGGSRVSLVCNNDCLIGKRLQDYGDQLITNSLQRKGKSA
ncbi:hypothetical protein D3C81_1735380 [compost metagenome]